MELKSNQNIAISYYWHQFSGLVHFSFTSRQDNSCIIPAIQQFASAAHTITEATVSLAYRKYLPLALTLLYKHSCAQFQATDDKLRLVFTYLIWFEDTKGNYIPVDFLTSECKQDQELKSAPPGITDISYYDLLPKVLYPNAPENSLACFELFCVHSAGLSEISIRNQLNLMIGSLSRKKRGH